MIKPIFSPQSRNPHKPKIKRLEILVNDQIIGTLEKDVYYRFQYTDSNAALLGLHYQDRSKVYQSYGLPHIFAQYFPEGFLAAHIHSKYRFDDAPFQDNEMLRLAILGRDTLGRIRVHCDEPLFHEWMATLERPNRLLSVNELLGGYADQVFEDYLNDTFKTGRFVTVSGVQKKMSLDILGRNTKQSVAYIAKGFNQDIYPCLAANEYLCMQTAKKAGFPTAQTSLSEDSSILLVRRFDIDEENRFLGMEDFTSLRNFSTEEKYKGSYAAICGIIQAVSSRPDEDLADFFSQLACSCLLKNGDAHLKNFSVLYHNEHDVRLAPAYDILDTSLYAVGYKGFHETYDTELALNLTNKHGKQYPTRSELVRFGEEYCNLPKEAAEYIIDNLREAKEAVLAENVEVLHKNPWLANKWGRPQLDGLSETLDAVSP